MVAIFSVYSESERKHNSHPSMKRISKDLASSSILKAIGPMAE